MMYRHRKTGGRYYMERCLGRDVRLESAMGGPIVYMTFAQFRDDFTNLDGSEID